MLHTCRCLHLVDGVLTSVCWFTNRFSFDPGCISSFPFLQKSRLIMKNQDPSGKRAVSPLALEEAGCMTVCRSGAWGAKMVTSAWWVYADQVKTWFLNFVCIAWVLWSCSARRDKPLHAAHFRASVSLLLLVYCIIPVQVFDFSAPSGDRSLLCCRGSWFVYASLYPGYLCYSSPSFSTESKKSSSSLRSS